MIEVPLKQRAVVGLEDGSLSVSTNVDVAQIEDHMVLVRTRAIGLNPIDTKMKGPLAAPGAIAGIDFSGEVVSIGSKASTPATIKVGDRVFGAATGYQTPKPTLGAFAEFVAIHSAGLLKIPDDWSFEQAASLGCSLSTIGLALFKSLNVPGSPKHPAEKPVDVFVYGGSTTTGTVALQLLKM
ncbi:putative secondary metabolism biosynthetic enzyme [Amphichorda felina]